METHDGNALRRRAISAKRVRGCGYGGAVTDKLTAKQFEKESDVGYLRRARRILVYRSMNETLGKILYGDKNVDDWPQQPTEVEIAAFASEVFERR